MQSKQSKYAKQEQEGGDPTDYTLTSGEAGKLLGVTSQAMRDLARAGEISHEIRTRRTRAYYFFRREDVEQLAAERRAPKNLHEQRTS